MTADSSTPPLADSMRRGAGGYFVLALLSMVGVGATGWSYFRLQQTEALRAVQETLAAIADLKAGQIADWMKERRSDAEVSLGIIQAQRFLAEPDNGTLRDDLFQ